MKTLCDPLRTIDAGRINGVNHIMKDKCLQTLCGLDIKFGDLLVFRQKPDEITCAKCKQSEGNNGDSNGTARDKVETKGLPKM